MRTTMLLLVLVAANVPAFAQQPAATPVPVRDCPTCPVIAVVPPGTFSMGTAPDAYEVDRSTGETPALQVTIGRPFVIAARETTFGEFRRYVEATGREPAPGCRVWQGGQWVLDRARSWRDPGFGQPPADDEPVVCVNWDDAQGYAEWLSGVAGRKYRLPSESEWEYVARGGTSFPRYWGWRESHEGVSISLACDNANVYDIAALSTYEFPWPNARCSDRMPGLALAAQYKPNAFGVYDIIGNAREWVQDCYTASYKGRPQDARAWVWQGGCELRGVRGGSWASRPAIARAAARGAELQSARQSDLGFRVARDQDAPAAAPAATPAPAGAPAAPPATSRTAPGTGTPASVSRVVARPVASSSSDAAGASP